MQFRALLDVQFQIGGQFPSFTPGPVYIVQVAAEISQAAAYIYPSHHQ
jgi:hypothetical protein